MRTVERRAVALCVSQFTLGLSHTEYIRPRTCDRNDRCEFSQVALSLYVHLGRRVLLQVEAFLGRLLLPLAEGKAALGIARQEAALEVRNFNQKVKNATSGPLRTCQVIVGLNRKPPQGEHTVMISAAQVSRELAKNFVVLLFEPACSLIDYIHRSLDEKHIWTSQVGPVSESFMQFGPLVLI